MRACSTRSELEKLDARTVTRPDNLNHTTARAHPRSLGVRMDIPAAITHSSREDISARSPCVPGQTLASPIRPWAAETLQNGGLLRTSVSLTSSASCTPHPLHPSVQPGRARCTNGWSYFFSSPFFSIPSYSILVISSCIKTEADVLVTNPT
jgi:hypothetical protein